jgi:hypothetical protein
MCIDNRDYPASLEVGKAYRVLPTHGNCPEGWIRVIDESGEDYLYRGSRFVPIDLPTKARRALALADG